MNKNLMTKAEELANRAYTTIIMLDETTDGDPVYISVSPELEGCIGQGKTVEEAEISMKEARVDFIFSLLIDDLPVPDPMPINSTTTTSDDGTFIFQHNLQSVQFFGDANTEISLRVQPLQSVPC